MHVLIMNMRYIDFPTSEDRAWLLDFDGEVKKNIN